MKKSLLSLIFAITLLTACGNSSEKAVKDAYKEIGLEDDEINELMSDLDEEDFEELAEIYSELAEESNNYEEDVEESIENVSITMSDTIKNAKLSDGIIQIYDMIFSVDGSMTIGEAVKVLENSSLSLDYDIPEGGMITGYTKYTIRYDGNDLFSLIAIIPTDDNNVDTYDGMLADIEYESSLKREYVWIPTGIASGDDMDSIEKKLIDSNLTDGNDPTTYHYKLNGATYSATVPAKNNSLNGGRYDLTYNIYIDTSDKTVESFSVNHNDVGISNYAKALAYFNNATAITKNEQVNDAIIQKLDEFDDIYIGNEIECPFQSPITPTSAKLYSVCVLNDCTAQIVTKCDTENGVKYITAPIAPIYTNEAGDIFVSYGEKDPFITYDSQIYSSYEGTIFVDWLLLISLKTIANPMWNYGDIRYENKNNMPFYPNGIIYDFLWNNGKSRNYCIK